MRHAPRIESFKIPTDKIREVIGTGGKVIREIVEKTGAKVNIEDDGSVKVASANADSIKAAINWIKSIASDPEVGHIYEGTVVKVMGIDPAHLLVLVWAGAGIDPVGLQADEPRNRQAANGAGRDVAGGSGAPGLYSHNAGHQCEAAQGSPEALCCNGHLVGKERVFAPKHACCAVWGSPVKEG